jgi:hypothetical protein
MPRTAPTVDGSGNYRQIVLKFVDADGEPRSDRYEISAAATDAQVEALVVAVGAQSNANLYQVQVVTVYNAAKLKSAAVDAPRMSVHDNIVSLWKDTANNSRDFFLPAPTQDNFVAGTVNPDPVSGLGDILDALNNVFETAFQPISVRFT